MTLTDQRRSYLRGSYLDRIIECAQHYAATHSYFIDAEFLAFIVDEFDYLSELSTEEQQYLRDQVGLESLRRVALSRAKDREEVFGKFVAENSDVVSADADFAFDLGWLDLAKDAATRIRTYPKSWKVTLTGGKEKFGCLVLFLPCDYGQRGCRSEVERLLEEVRLRSLATCDICGAVGRLRLGNWAKTVCDRHAAIFEGFREMTACGRIRGNGTRTTRVSHRRRLRSRKRSPPTSSSYPDASASCCLASCSRSKKPSKAARSVMRIWTTTFAATSRLGSFRVWIRRRSTTRTRPGCTDMSVRPSGKSVSGSAAKDKRRLFPTKEWTMSIISVASGWQHILNEAVAEAQTLPQEWCFEITQAETVDGGLKLSATYVSGDVPLDDHLPAERKLPHPWRAMMRIRENAKQKSLVTCECCGREGRQIGAGEDARVRCVRHEDVIDVEQWEEKRASMRPMFETEEEAVEHFRQDYGKGVDMMRDLQTAVEQDSGEPDPKSKH